ncbi:hypothetical protein LPW41_09240 [Microbacterium sp. JC 701]|uniref:hypothetical protein n=1 Tax=unclassified Microbacterium TaxID=2609290 RepID=UPI0011A40D27|nr:MULTISPECIES: hypothetical protein [unclassified Microbacterium]MCD2169888.1 hypothetical protein [Microbacterium sp. JC 701]
MTPAASPPPGRRAVERAVRLLLALFLLCSAWATTHVDVDAGDHEGTAHAAVTVGSLAHADSDGAPAVDLVPPVEADAVHSSTADGTTVLVLALAAAVAVVPFVTRRGPRSVDVPDAPPPRHPLSLSSVSRT